MTGIGKSPHVFNRRDTSTHSCLENFLASHSFVFFGGGNVLLSGFSNFETNNLAKCMYDLLNWFIFLVNEPNMASESRSCFRNTSSTGSQKKQANEKITKRLSQVGLSKTPPNSQNDTKNILGIFTAIASKVGEQLWGSKLSTRYGNELVVQVC